MIFPSQNFYLQYIDSSQEEPDFKSSQQQRKKKRICCLADNAATQLVKEFGSDSNDMIIQRALNERRQGQIKNKLLLNIEDKQLERNIQKRNANYQYFVQRVQIDEKYEALQKKKSEVQREKNLQKQKTHKNHKLISECKEEETLLRKFIVQKKEKQEIVFNNLKKQVVEMEKEKKISMNQQLKDQINRKREKRKIEMENVLNRQANELEQLREKLEQIKEEKKVNKLEERKVIKELRGQLKEDKRSMGVRIKKQSNFVV